MKHSYFMNEWSSSQIDISSTLWIKKLEAQCMLSYNEAYYYKCAWVTREIIVKGWIYAHVWYKMFFYLPYQKIHNISIQSQQLLHPKPRIYWSVSNPFSFSQAIILIIWDFSLVCIMNSLPFVGFGFLDNFTMIIGLYAKIIPLQM